MFPFNDLSDYQFKHMDEPLILPDDILGIIRALSKPVFLHAVDYNAYVRMFRKEYPELRSKLSANDEDTVVALRAYLDADQYIKQTGEIYTDHMTRPRPDNVRDLIQYRVTQHELHEENRYAAWWACHCHRALHSVVLDIEFDFWEFENMNPLYEEDDDDYSLRRWERTHNRWERTDQGW
jgi:hypothetical protein